jgi:hypothetical protein
VCNMYVIVCLVLGWNLLCWLLWVVVCICNCVFGCRLEFNIVVLREIFAGELENLTGSWGKL